MLYTLSNDIDDGKLAEIKSAEAEIGQPLLAFNGHDLSPAQLSENDVAKVKALEKDLGLVLVAVDG